MMQKEHQHWGNKIVPEVYTVLTAMLTAVVLVVATTGKIATTTTTHQHQDARVRNQNVSSYTANVLLPLFGVQRKNVYVFHVKTKWAMKRRLKQQRMLYWNEILEHLRINLGVNLLEVGEVIPLSIRMPWHKVLVVPDHIIHSQNKLWVPVLTIWVSRYN